MTANNRKNRTRLWWVPVVLCTLLFSSCGQDGYSRYYTFKETGNTVYENGLADNDIMLTVEGYGLSYSELRYYLLSEAEVRGGIADMSAEEAREWVDQTVIPDLLFSRAAASIAQEYEVDLTKTERKALTDYIAQMKEQDSDGYRQLLSERFLTDDLYAFIALQDQLISKLLSYYTDEATSPIQASDQVIEACAENGQMIHIKHILIKNDAGEDPEENRALAERLRKELDAGADFDQLMQEYSEDPESEKEPDGYYIFRYEMDPAFEQAAFALAEGQLSAVTRVSADSYTGYHIILRQAIDENFVSENINTLRTNYMTSCFYRDLQTRAQQLTVEYSEQYQALDLSGGF